MNRLEGTITAIQSSGGISLIDLDVGGHPFSSLVIETPNSDPYLQPGKAVRVLFKETEVSITKGFSGGISCRNRIPATITALEKSEILTKLTLDFRGERVVSIITTRSAEALQLAVGDRVEGIVKSNEITVKKVSA